MSKGIFRLGKEANRLLSIVINRLRKEINKLLSKGMSNIYLKVTIKMYSQLQFSGFEKLCHQVSFWGAPTTRDIIEF